MTSSPATASTPVRRWRRFGWLVIGILLVASLGLAQFYKGSLFGTSGNLKQITPPVCDLNEHACPLPLVSSGNMETWQFAITPRPVPVSAPLSFSLTPPANTTVQPVAVWVDLTGESMDMGLIRVPLTVTADGRWQGSGSIPVCVTGQMRWRASLHIQSANATQQADWVFAAPLTTNH